MSQHSQATSVGRVDHRTECVGVELDSEDIAARSQHPTAGHHLDHVDATLVMGVHDPLSVLGVGHHSAQEVAVSIGDGQWWPARDDPWGSRARIIAERQSPESAVTEIAHGGDPGGRLLGECARDDCVELALTQGPCPFQASHLCVSDEMDVTIDQPRQKGALELDHDTFFGKSAAEGLHTHDQVPFDKDGRALGQEGHPIEDHSRAKSMQTPDHLVSIRRPQAQSDHVSEAISTTPAARGATPTRPARFIAGVETQTAMLTGRSIHKDRRSIPATHAVVNGPAGAAFAAEGAS